MRPVREPFYVGQQQTCVHFKDHDVLVGNGPVTVPMLVKVRVAIISISLNTLYLEKICHTITLRLS